MGIRDVIARARRAQQDHEQKHPVQLEFIEIPVYTLYENEWDDDFMEWERRHGFRLWASEEEQLQWFRNEYLSPTELQMLRTDMAMHPQDY
jgi:hypothetical protein